MIKINTFFNMFLKIADHEKQTSWKKKNKSYKTYNSKHIHANFPDLIEIFLILHAIPDFQIGIPNNTRNPDFVKIHPDLRQWPPISYSNSKSRASSLGLTNQKSGSQNRHYCLPVSRVGMCIHNLPL